MSTRGKIFVSYRRDQSRADARSIFQQLQMKFGADQVFMDVDSIPRGQDFRGHLERSLGRCEVLVAVIGSQWLDASDDGGRRRLDLADDFVRLEIAVALAREIPVIPVLIDGARLPHTEQLPAELHGLVFKQAATVRHETFGRDVAVLLEDIAGILEQARDRRRRRLAIGILGAMMLAGTAVGAQWHLSRAGGADASPGPAPSAAALAWQKVVKPVAFTVEDSTGVGRPESPARRLAAISDGKVTLSLIAPLAGRKATDRLDVLSRGMTDAVWETPSFWSDKAPALALFGGQVPFGLTAAKLHAWLRVRGGKELDDLYQRRLGLNVKAVPCRLWPPEGMWFRKPIEHPEQLSGMAIRTTSFLFARLAGRLGFRQVLLPGREIAAALEKGTIDGAELSSPLVDHDFGLHKVARNYYFPGLHAPATAAYLHFNLDRWNAFDEPTRGLIEEACATQIAADVAGIDDQVKRGLARLKQAGIDAHPIPPAVAVAVEHAMRAAADELSAADPDFKRIYASFLANR